MSQGCVDLWGPSMMPALLPLAHHTCVHSTSTRTHARTARKQAPAGSARAPSTAWPRSSRSPGPMLAWPRLPLAPPWRQWSERAGVLLHSLQPCAQPPAYMRASAWACQAVQTLHRGLVCTEGSCTGRCAHFCTGRAFLCTGTLHRALSAGRARLLCNTLSTLLGTALSTFLCSGTHSVCVCTHPCIYACT